MLRIKTRYKLRQVTPGNAQKRYLVFRVPNYITLSIIDNFILKLRLFGDEGAYIEKRTQVYNRHPQTGKTRYRVTLREGREKYRYFGVTSNAKPDTRITLGRLFAKPLELA